jgi:hypothetical protein
MVHQWHYHRLLPPLPTACRRLPWVRHLVPTTTTLALPTTICSVPSRCSNVAPRALIVAIATAQPYPISQRHPGSPFTTVLAARPSLGSPECTAKREEDPYLVNVPTMPRVSLLDRLHLPPRHPPTLDYPASSTPSGCQGPTRMLSARCPHNIRHRFCQRHRRLPRLTFAAPPPPDCLLSQNCK